MGAYSFEVYRHETDVKKAFRDAVEQARYDHGHAGYTGTIAEKHDYTVIRQEPMTYEDAQEEASRLLDRDDPRVSDKWGPAGAIRVKGGDKEHRFFRSGLQYDTATGCQDEEFDGWLFFGFASS